jgi:chromosomal replication initiator protein
MWIRPLHAEERGDALYLLAPNHYWTRYIQEHHLEQIRFLVNQASDGRIQDVLVQVDSRPGEILADIPAVQSAKKAAGMAGAGSATTSAGKSADSEATTSKAGNSMLQKRRMLNSQFTFSLFVEGRSNQMAAETCRKVLTQLGEPQHNPLFLYGPTGLGKTHLMHAVGNALLQAKPNARVMYMTSESFVQDFVSSLQRGKVDEF